MIKNIFKVILTILISATFTIAIGQVSNQKVNYLCYRFKDQKNGKWEDWSEWVKSKSEVIVEINFDRSEIIIHTTLKQVYLFSNYQVSMDEKNEYEIIVFDCYTNNGIKTMITSFVDVDYEFFIVVDQGSAKSVWTSKNLIR
jgi:hypothetical protein